MIQLTSYQSINYDSVKSILQEVDLFDEVWDSLDNLASMIATNPNAILVAKDNDSIVGVIMTISYGDNVSYFFRLAINPNRQNQGIGTKLLKHAESITQENSNHEVGLYVDANNKKLIDFYNKRGYQTSKKHYIYMHKSNL